MERIWTDAELFARLVEDGQPRLVEALRRIAEEKNTNLLAACQCEVSDDAEVVAQVRAFVKRHGGEVLVGDEAESQAEAG